MLQIAKNLKEFMSLSGEEQQLSLMKMCSRCKTIAHLNTYTDKDGNKIANPLWFADWLVTKDDYLTASAEGYIRLMDITAEEPKMPFSRAMFKACWNALQSIYRAEMKHVNCLVKAVDSDNPEMDGLPVIDLEAYEVKQVFTAPEDYVFIDTLLESCKDWKDKFIISKKADGYENIEIAEMLDCSRQSIDKRLKKIHNRYREVRKPTYEELLKHAFSQCNNEYCVDLYDGISNPDNRDDGWVAWQLEEVRWMQEVNSRRK